MGMREEQEMGDKKELIQQFFPTEADRSRASRAIDAEASRFLSRYPGTLVQKVRALKKSGLSLKEIYETLGRDPRIPEIAMHLAVKGQAEEIGRS